MKVCILNYGSGNVQSVFNLLNTLTTDVQITNDPAYIREATHLILPGVGAFAPAMQKIRATIDLELLRQQVMEEKKPFLGICVGMQVLAEKGYEFGEHDGLGWIKGKVEQLDSKDLPLPHIGWNNLIIKRTDCPLVADMNDEFDFYYVHSYVLKPSEQQDVVASANYGDAFSSVVNKDNIYGVQFHPEKSQVAGKKLILNFLKNC
jgi:imidazole glycerol-phosphate synthase subunit HisH